VSGADSRQQLQLYQQRRQHSLEADGSYADDEEGEEEEGGQLLLQQLQQQGCAVHKNPKQQASLFSSAAAAGAGDAGSGGAAAAADRSLACGSKYRILSESGGSRSKAIAQVSCCNTLVNA
jgi:hypothetical protein